MVEDKAQERRRPFGPAVGAHGMMFRRRLIFAQGGACGFARLMDEANASGATPLGG